MTISLEWVRLPNQTCFCTICRHGVPVPEPTRYLLSYVHPDHGSTHTVRTYGQRLLPFFKWLDRHQTALTRVDLERFRRDLTLVTPSGDPLLQKRAHSAPSTLYYAVAAAARFIIWAVGYSDTEPSLYGGQVIAAVIVQARMPRSPALLLLHTETGERFSEMLERTASGYRKALIANKGSLRQREEKFFDFTSAKMVRR